MKPIRVTTKNVLKNKFSSCSFISFGIIIHLMILILGCSESDDNESILNDPPLVDEEPTESQTPTESESTIIYTDLEPDLLSEDISHYYDLDVNNDGIIDYSLYTESTHTEVYFMMKSNPNITNGIISVTPWYTNPVPLRHGIEIFGLAGFTNGETYESYGFFTIGDCFGGEPNCFYDWKGKGDRYLGLRFFINDKTHYGWARLNVESPLRWVIKDYAYNATPNRYILSGQKE